MSQPAGESPHPATPVAPSADVYSAGERSWMAQYQAFKQRLLQPLLTWMSQRRVRPNHVTLVAWICGLAFCPLYLSTDYAWTAVAAYVFLVLHVILDGIDGPLARAEGVASPAGSFVDTLADQSVIALTTLTYIQADLLGRPGLGVFAGGCYLFLYTIVVAMAMVRNALHRPYAWLLRPRYLVYGLMFLECLLWGVSSMALVSEGTVWLISIYFVVMIVVGWRALRQHMRPVE